MTIECAFFGSLARDAEAKTSKAGKQYLRLNVRVENGEAAQFINTTVFDTDAIADAARLRKGARVYIEGRLSLDTWTSADGAAKTGLSCMAFHCRLSAIGLGKIEAAKAGKQTLLKVPSLRAYAASLPPASIKPPTVRKRKGVA